jgi:hypothetical protein
MPNDEPTQWADEVQLSPQQLNEIIEDKLVHLKPVLEGALVELERTRDLFSREDESWREILARARLAVSQ